MLDGSNLLRVSHIHVLVIEEFVHKRDFLSLTYIMRPPLPLQVETNVF